MSERVFIIVPCFNESAVLRRTVEELLPLGHSVVVVDDGSAEPALRLVAGLPVHLLRHPLNLGQGAALQTGMDYALARGAEACVHFDSDGQHSRGDIPRFLEALRQGADLVVGSRFLRPQDLALVPRLKRLVLQGGRLVNLLLAGVWLSDSHNGFRALNRTAMEKIRLRENRMAHASEILAQAHRLGLRISEVPTTIHYSAYARQKGQRLSNALNIVIDLILNKVL